MQTIEYIDSHTGGEPTRMVISGCPDVGNGPLAERAMLLAEREDWLRKALILEPRGTEWIVGAYLVEPYEPDCTAGLIFFNNVKYLGMCGHGLIGAVTTLAHLGRLTPGSHRFDTPVGVVSAELNQDGSVTIQNVPSYRYQTQVNVSVPGLGTVEGDIAWGGNWFFLTKVDRLEAARIPELLRHANTIQQALIDQAITGEDGGVIDHIELFAPPLGGADSSGLANARNFVLCPGGEFDRSPCGTGTSAKLACLAADHSLQPGEEWIQESIIGSRFRGTYQPLENGRIAPTITGKAFVTGRTTCIIDPADPYRFGIELGTDS